MYNLTKSLVQEALALKSRNVSRWRKNIPLAAGTNINTAMSADKGLALLVTSIRLGDNASIGQVAVGVTTPDGAIVSNEAIPAPWLLSVPSISEFYSPQPNPMTAPILIPNGTQLGLNVLKAADTNNLIFSGVAVEEEIANQLVRSHGRYRVFQTGTTGGNRSTIDFNHFTVVDTLSGWADSRDSFGTFKVTINRARLPSYELYQMSGSGLGAAPSSPFAEEAFLGESFKPGLDSIVIESGTDNTGTLPMLATAREFL